MDDDGQLCPRPLDQPLGAIASDDPSRRPWEAHLGRAVDAAGATAGLVTLEDLIEHYVGTVRDATHARDDRA